MSQLDNIVAKVNKEYKEDILAKGIHRIITKKIPFTSPRLNYMLYGGLPRGYIIEFSGEENGGKALSMDCGILTPSGYKLMRDIHVGDEVISGSGFVSKVEGVYPQGVKPFYKVIFSDGTSAECSEDHLWSVRRHSTQRKSMSGAITMSTKELLNGYKYTDPKNENWHFYFYSIPTPILYDIDMKKDLPIDPYLLGILIADGSLNNNFGITIKEQDIFEKVQAKLKVWGMELRKYSANPDVYDYSIVYIDRTIHNQFTKDITLKNILGDMGLLCKSVDKHIPKEYLYTSVDNRIALLHGLFDGDGYTDKKGHWDYSTSSEQLSNDFEFLIHSLGGIDYVKCNQSYYKKGVEYKYCSLNYLHTIRFNNGIIPFSSKKHLSRYNPKRNNYHKKIIDIIRIDDKACQCIKVSDETHTFIMQGEIVTHNTTSALDVCKNAQKLFQTEWEEQLESITNEKERKILEERGPQKVVYCDVENTLDEDWARELGVNVDEMYILKPQTQAAESIFQIALDMINTGEVGLCVVDSLGVMMSQQAYDKDMTEKTYGGISMPLTLFSKKAELACHKYNCTLIGINQERDDLNSTWGGKTTTGGHAWKYQCILRIRFGKGDYLDESGNKLNRSCDEPKGNRVMASILKNKACKPDRRTGSYTLMYDYGIDEIMDLVDVGLKYGLVQQHGAWFNFVDIETGEIVCDEDGKEIKIQGQLNVNEFLLDNEVFLDEFRNKINELMF